MTNLERLLKVAESIDESRFDMRLYYGKDGIGNRDMIPNDRAAFQQNECGTTACLVGYYAAQSEELFDELFKIGYMVYDLDRPAAMRHFDINREELNDLFYDMKATKDDCVHKICKLLDERADRDKDTDNQ